MAVPGPTIEVGAVAVTATVARKSSAESGTEVRHVPAAAAPASVAEPRIEPAAREDVRELSERIAERLQQFLKDSGRDVEYRVDADAGATVITVRRSDTGEVVRQFPSEEALAWLRRLNEQSGTFVDALA
jgi:flagellar protein FlaG